MSLELGSKCLAYHGPLLYEAKIIRLHQPDEDFFESIDNKHTKLAKVKITKTNFPSAKFLNKLSYYLHYKGWNTKWDEWVGIDRVLAYTDENLEKAKAIQDEVNERKERELRELQEAQAAKEAALLAAKNKKEKEKKEKEKEKDKEKESKTKSKSKDKEPKTNGNSNDNSADVDDIKQRGNKDTIFSNSSNSNNGNNNKRRLDEVADFEDSFVKRPEISINVSDNLKSLLVDDWELVTKEKKLINLPVPQDLNINTILKKFASLYFKSVKVGSADYENGIELFDGLKMYFNRSLGTILLYQFEREQYSNILNDNKRFKFSKYLEKPIKKRELELTEIYGAEHLLRLLITLPGLVAQTSMDMKSVHLIKIFVEKFLVYLNEFSDELFSKDYVNTSFAYESLSRT